MNKKKLAAILVAICTLCALTLTSCSKPSEGLAYEENEDHITCTITGIGTCIDTDLKIPKKINGLEVIYIDNNAFDNRKSITSVSIPKTVRSIGEEAFQDCTSLTDVIILGEITDIEEYTFEGCESLVNINIPDSVTEIDSHAFKGCTSLTNITIPDSVTDIYSNAFEDCKSLKKITIPDGVSEIRGYTFYGCSSLESVTIPDSVTNIYSGAFKGCGNLKKIIFEGTVEEWNAIDLACLTYYEDEWGNGPWLTSEDWIDFGFGVEIEVVCSNGTIYV